MSQPATSLKIALAQLNPVVGDISGNAQKVKAAHAEAKRLGADIVVLPELFLTGYPPEDLVLKPAFQDASRAAAETLAAELGSGPAVVLGAVWPDGGKVYNAVTFIEDGRITAVRYKVELPNYGVFDEKRVFAQGPLPGPVSFRGVRLGAADLRGHLDRRGRRVPPGMRRGDPDRPPTARRSIGPSPKSASTSPSPASPRAACR